MASALALDGALVTASIASYMSRVRILYIDFEGDQKKMSEPLHFGQDSFSLALNFQTRIFCPMVLLQLNVGVFKGSNLPLFSTVL